MHTYLLSTSHHRELWPLAGLLCLVELCWWTFVAGRHYPWRSSASTLAIALGHVLVDGAAALLLVPLYQLVYRVAPWHWPLRDWRTWVVGFVLVEFAYYWFHRLSHRVRWMWATHAVHHTPEHITLLSSIRLGWTNLVSAGWVVYLPVMALGFDPRLVLTILAIDLRFQFFLHTEAKLRFGPLEWLFNTPSHHRVHHASNPAYIDRNFGGMLIVFDRLFGTFAAERANEPPRYGLVHPLRSDNPFVLALGEWRRLWRDARASSGWLAVLRMALGRP